MFDERDYSNHSHIGDEPITIGDFVGKNYVNDIYVDSGSCTNIMHKHLYKQLPGYVQKKD